MHRGPLLSGNKCIAARYFPVTSASRPATFRSKLYSYAICNNIEYIDDSRSSVSCLTSIFAWDRHHVLPALRRENILGISKTSKLSGLEKIWSSLLGNIFIWSRFSVGRSWTYRSGSGRIRFRNTAKTFYFLFRIETSRVWVLVGSNPRLLNATAMAELLNQQVESIRERAERQVGVIIDSFAAGDEVRKRISFHAA